MQLLLSLKIIHQPISDKYLFVKVLALDRSYNDYNYVEPIHSLSTIAINVITYVTDIMHKVNYNYLEKLMLVTNGAI